LYDWAPNTQWLVTGDWGGKAKRVGVSGAANGADAIKAAMRSFPELENVTVAPHKGKVAEAKRVLEWTAAEEKKQNHPTVTETMRRMIDKSKGVYQFDGGVLVPRKLDYVL
jgi:hypothetical protein